MAITTGPKSRVPLGSEGLSMGLKIACISDYYHYFLPPQNKNRHADNPPQTQEPQG